MGISKLIGLMASALFLLFLFFKRLQLPFLYIPILYSSLISFLVSIASHPYVNLPLLLGKSSDGTFPLWTTLLFGPFLFFIRIFVFLRRRMIGEPLFTEISEGLFVGGWPSSLEHLPPGNPAVIDCTCELPRSSALWHNAYICIATWDTRAPEPFQIESAVQWAFKKRALKKPVYIHCAYGHGRSVCVMCALLVTLGLAEDWKKAENMIKEKRPSINLNDLHRRNLEEWSKNRITPKRVAETALSSLFLSNTSAKK
ncbi:uncharacterized protein LOC110092594 [Dendrobium catenatum]|uniref:Tyrosine specific protein phosphatases domain-containing protein n=1 Tax=Dendrobium catenatum TaxID=906689 RepID=A0A2I0XIT1_9ASPA|nr:uncharacterized protein LOC110092594 [Dendrobium catenatum]PKU87808.1 hypothetical protein MA16_Dca021154 [Dendrobium catenatum]